MTHKVGEHLVITRGGADADNLDDTDPDAYHMLNKGVLVRVTDIYQSDAKEGWGVQYIVEPVDDRNDLWVDLDSKGDQYVFDIHVELAPRPDVSDLAAIEKFLEAP